MIHSISSSHSASAPGLSPRRSAAKKSFTTWTFSWALIEILALLPGSVLLTPSGHGSRTHEFERSEERRVGKECVSACRYGWTPYQYKKIVTRRIREQ